MKYSKFIFLPVFLIVNLAYSQEWVEQQYEYDSLLNVEYGSALNFNGELTNLQMDIYFPKCENPAASSTWPLLMWIHGGSFLAGNKEDPSIQALCKNFAKRGYVTASINYRLGFIADEAQWECNYPDYSCVFATDSAEWARAYYRAVQDGKGALRYLINRNEEYEIDVNNVFIAGESAGAFTALGVGLMDTLLERPPQTFSIADAPTPHPNTLDCVYNQGVTFDGNPIARPDLGGIEGDIEPTTINYTIKGIGNMYGAMMSDLLKYIPDNKPQPAIYSFHRPCDIIVSIDSNYVYWGLSWCFTNGYGCFGIANNKIMCYGGRVFSQWNEDNNYGYDMQNEFSGPNFPYNFLFGEGSCLDQVNNPCHAYDSKTLRENNLATFFSTKVTTCACKPIATHEPEEDFKEIKISPNPSHDLLRLSGNSLTDLEEILLYDLLGTKIHSIQRIDNNEIVIDMSALPAGLYILSMRAKNDRIKSVKIIKK